MAVELAQAYVSIIPSARGIKQNLSRELAPLDREGTAAGDRTARNFGRTFVAGVGSAATTGALALGAGFTLAAGFGIKAAADFEQTQIAFEGILGNKDAADELIGSLRDLANVSPFEFPNLTKSARQLLAVGTRAEDIVPTMSILGDQAAALGLGAFEIEGVVRALGQMKGKGKVSAEELRQISEQFPGFSAINAIAEDLGVTVGEAFKIVEKGAVPADEGIQAILDGMAKFPGASGAMERQSKTLNGVISTFKDTLTTTAIDFITPYLPQISAGVAAFGGFIRDTAVPALQDFIDFISETVAPGVEVFVDLFREEGLAGVLGRLGELIKIHGPAILEALAGMLAAAVTWFQEDGVGMLADGIRVLIPTLIDWVTEDVIPGLFDKDGAFWKMLEAFAEWVATEGVPDFLRGGKELGAAIVQGIFEGLAEDFDELNKQTLDLGPLGEYEIPVGFRAAGGPVGMGKPYIVGEQGPELFVPGRSGVIVPNGALMPAAGASGPLVAGDVIVQGVSTEDAGTAMLRGLRKIRLMTAA